MDEEKKIKLFEVSVALLLVLQGGLLFCRDALSGEVNQKQFDNIMTAQQINNDFLRASIYWNMGVDTNTSAYLKRVPEAINESNNRLIGVFKSNEEISAIKDNVTLFSNFIYITHGILLFLSITLLYATFRIKEKTRKKHRKDIQP